jgi:hypothetical protein
MGLSTSLTSRRGVPPMHGGGVQLCDGVLHFLAPDEIDEVGVGRKREALVAGGCRSDDWVLLPVAM